MVRGYFDSRTRDGDVEYWARSWSDDATVEAMRSQTWRVQLGFAGMQSDGEYDQAVFARLHKRS